MKGCIIGSVALKVYCPELKTTSDIDILVEENTIKKVGNVEYHTNPILWKKYKDKSIISAEDLLSLKISHAFWDIH